MINNADKGTSYTKSAIIKRRGTIFILFVFLFLFIFNQINQLKDNYWNVSNFFYSSSFAYTVVLNEIKKDNSWLQKLGQEPILDDFDPDQIDTVDEAMKKVRNSFENKMGYQVLRIEPKFNYNGATDLDDLMYINVEYRIPRDFSFFNEKDGITKQHINITVAIIFAIHLILLRLFSSWSNKKFWIYTLISGIIIIVAVFILQFNLYFSLW